MSPTPCPPPPACSSLGDIWVTIIGAGITGLTAAHELVERGFRVQVIEANAASPTDVSAAPISLVEGLDDVDVGGIARTQWSVLPAGACLGVGPAPLVELSSIAATAAEPPLIPPPITDDNAPPRAFCTGTPPSRCWM